MKNIKKFLSSFFIVIFLLSCGFCGGYFYFDYKNSNESEVVSSGTQTDITLPFEVEKRMVTVEEIQTELKEIEELSAYEGDYTVKKSVDESRYLIDNYKIPGTKNTITIECKGKIKVGYDFNEIYKGLKVDNESRKIYIALPKARINDNYVIMDSVVCQEKNSILNPINFEQYKTLLSEIEELGKQDAEKKGIYQKAEDNIKKIINKTLLQFEGFEVVYM